MAIFAGAGAGIAGRTRAQDSPDAIAIRVIPNIEHYSPARWYAVNIKQLGSPQSLNVDGYEAVRDGRSVYVNAANVAGNNLYTNIYLISYNQESEPATVDIFGEILSHWKFNTNFTTTGSCISADPASSTIEQLNCLNVGDCPSDTYCNSEKSELVRDTKRLADLTDIRIYLDEYKSSRSKYPGLEAGTYLPGRSLSAWPSWQDTLAAEIGLTLPIDPTNRLGSCPGYDRNTCWDEKSKKFYNAGNSLVLPAGSRVYSYYTKNAGSSYEMCAVMESGYINTPEQGACPGSRNFVLKGAADNNAPQFLKTNLSHGYSGKSFSGYIEASDADGDNLTWSIDLGTSTFEGWGEPPLKLLPTANPNQRKLAADLVGAGGVFYFHIAINDGREAANSVTTKLFYINIDNPPPVIKGYHDMEYRVSSVNPLQLSFTAEDDPLHYPMDYSMVKGVIFPNATTSFTGNGNIYNFSLGGVFDPAQHQFPQTEKIDYSFRFFDKYHSSAQASFTVTIINNPPTISADNCAGTIRVNNNYNCQPLSYDPEANAIKEYAAEGLPAGLSLDRNSGNITGSPMAAGSYHMIIKAQDEYGAIGEKALDLTVKTYCGDQIRQNPNDEEIAEQCDGRNNIAPSPINSSESRQYACTAGCQMTGGWCGDGTIQEDYGENCDPLISKAEYDDLQGQITSTSTWRNYQRQCQLSYCHIGCVNDDNRDRIGMGCYLDDDGNDVIDRTECQRGIYVCESSGGENADFGKVVCRDRFLRSVWDECCRKVNYGSQQNYTFDPSVFDGVTVIKPEIRAFPEFNPFYGNYSYDGNVMYYPDDFEDESLSTFTYCGNCRDTGGSTANYQTNKHYNCDQVCANRNMICIGVGLTDTRVDNCVYVYDDILNSNGIAQCNSQNFATSTCSHHFGFFLGSTFPIATSSAHCIYDYYDTGTNDVTTGIYWVGTASCYCSDPEVE